MAKLTKKAATQLREHLAGQEHDRLVDLVMAEVERNSALKEQLLLEIAHTGGPVDAVERYADVLGDEGVAEMRRLAEARWADLPELPPGAGFDRTPGRFHLERMMGEARHPRR